MENNLVKYIVYCTTCVVNNKIYIGVHKTNPNIYDSYVGNGCYSNQPHTYKFSKTKFQAAINKYGIKNFRRATIAVFDTADEAYALEEEIVNEQFLSRPDVYNMALGGKGGSWNLTAQTVYQYDSTGLFIREYPSMKEAAVTVNRNLRSIQRALENKNKCASYYWTTTKYDKLDLSKMYNYEGQETIPVFQYNDKGEYECCYDSIRKTAKVLNIYPTAIGNAIKLGCICHNKYFTRVYSNNFSIAKHKQNQSLEVHQYDLNGNYLNSYPNMAEAKRATGIKSDIYKAIKLGRLAGNYQWSFEKIEKMSKVQAKSGRARKVGKYDKNWKLIKTYNSLAQCKKENGVSVQHVLSGRNEFSKGYRYKYLD